MEKGSNNRAAPRQEVAYSGYAQHVPAKSNVVPHYQSSMKYKNEDKALGITNATPPQRRPRAVPATWSVEVVNWA